VTVIKTEGGDNEAAAAAEIYNGDSCDVYEDDDYRAETSFVEEDFDESPKPKSRGRRKRANGRHQVIFQLNL
jgi:hypothetical protein